MKLIESDIKSRHRVGTFAWHTARKVVDANTGSNRALNDVWGPIYDHLWKSFKASHTIRYAPLPIRIN
jgi:hypothetical protein